jgi:hypothetical protein
LNSCAKAQSRQGAKERHDHDVVKGHASSINRAPDYQSHWRAGKWGTLISANLP